jgi:hypothetical protein
VDKPDAERALLDNFLKLRSKIESNILKVLLRQSQSIACVGEEDIAAVLINGHI